MADLFDLLAAEVIDPTVTCSGKIKEMLPLGKLVIVDGVPHISSKGTSCFNCSLANGATCYILYAKSFNCGGLFDNGHRVIFKKVDSND